MNSHAERTTAEPTTFHYDEHPVRAAFFPSDDTIRVDVLALGGALDRPRFVGWPAARVIPEFVHDDETDEVLILLPPSSILALADGPWGLSAGGRERLQDWLHTVSTALGAVGVDGDL